MRSTNSNLANLVEKVIGAEAAARVNRLLTIPSVFAVWECGWVSRKEMAQALNMVLFHDLLERVPTGRRYTEEVAERGEKVFHDHGALRRLIHLFKYEGIPTLAVPLARLAMRAMPRVFLASLWHLVIARGTAARGSALFLVGRRLGTIGTWLRRK